MTEPLTIELCQQYRDLIEQLEISRNRNSTEPLPIATTHYDGSNHSHYITITHPNGSETYLDTLQDILDYAPDLGGYN